MQATARRPGRVGLPAGRPCPRSSIPLATPKRDDQTTDPAAAALSRDRLLFFVEAWGNLYRGTGTEMHVMNYRSVTFDL